MNYWTRHLEEVDETYFQHMRTAFSFAGQMLLGTIACSIHALLPFLLERSGSDKIQMLHDCMVVNRKILKSVDKDVIDASADSGVTST